MAPGDAQGLEVPLHGLQQDGALPTVDGPQVFQVGLEIVLGHNAVADDLGPHIGWTSSPCLHTTIFCRTALGPMA